MSARRQSPRRPSSTRRGAIPPATVLVVDDEAAVCETIAEVLSLANYRVITAASVAEAEAAMRRRGRAGFHLVIVDVHLTSEREVRAGYALAQRWRARYPGLPVILISGDPRNEDLPDVRSGAMRFLLKPFRLEVFTEAVRQALGR